MPLQVGELPTFVRAISPIAQKFGTNPDWWRLLTEDGDALIDAMAIACRKPREWVASLTLDDGVTLADAIFEVNLNFFIQRVLPMLTGASIRLQQRASGAKPGTGAISSSDLSTPATATPTS